MQVLKSCIWFKKPCAVVVVELWQWWCSECRKALQLARQLKDLAVEAQACYSLGNTYTLLQDYERAIDYHLKHLIIAQDLNDRCFHALVVVEELRINNCTHKLCAIIYSRGVISCILRMENVFFLQDRWRKGLLEFGKRTYSTRESWPGHALCREALRNLKRGTYSYRLIGR